MRSLLVLALVAAALCAGCAKKMTDDDCRRISDNMRDIWALEAKKAAPAEGPGGERAAAVVKVEGERLVADWSAECKKELQGRRIDPKEVDCLLAARTIDQITRCAEL